MATATDPTIEITQAGPQQFQLAVSIGGQRFDCGSYISRAAAKQAGRLFVARKEAEAIARRKRPRRS